MKTSIEAPAGGAVPFSSRVKRRHDEYWRRRWFTLHQKAFCQLAYRSRDDSFEQWHCCAMWQRKLANKWNSREFAIKLGCPVPELYWFGTRVDEIPFSSLPDRYVIRAVVGFSRRAVLVLDRGRNLLNGEQYDAPRIREAMRPHAGGFPPRRLLVEEFVPPEPEDDFQLPRDYKIYIFGDRIGAIQVIERRSEAFVTAFNEGWDPLPPIRQRTRLIEVLPRRPDCLDEMLAISRKFANAYGSFVRVDLYVGSQGAVFGECTGTPAEGRGYSEYCNRYFGELWEETFPDAL